MSENLREFIMTWKIENFSYFWHKYGDAIKSPGFCGDSFESTKWRLLVYPRGRVNKDYISCWLERNMDGPEEIKLNVEISFIGHEGSVLAQKFSRNELFMKSQEKGFNSFVKRDEVFADKRAEFLPGDILTVRCRLRTKDSNTLEIEKMSIRSRIKVDRKLVSGIVGGFSSIPIGEVRSVRITSASEEISECSMNLQLTDRMDCDENLMLQVIFPKNKPRKPSTCKVYLPDDVGNKLECGKAAKDIELFQDWTFLLFPTKWMLMAQKSLYLSNDILSLECEIIISKEEIEEIGDEVSIELNPASDADRFENLRPSSSALKDLGNLYRDQVLCDVTLRTDTEAFPAHTVILSARSSVFRAMFTSDMKEKRNACVNISDFGSETVRQLLLYAYTDTVEDLKWDTAFQLYRAADKYAIASLKEKCSTFLKNFLCTSNACELLVLSDTHQYNDFKKFVQNFIYQNDENILCSTEWKDLGQKNPQLIIETLSQMYRNARAFLKKCQIIK